jgi:predicted nicotinamide N-methyase
VTARLRVPRERDGGGRDPDVAAFLRARLPVQPVPTVPEIKLHAAGPRSGLRRWAGQAGEVGPPYWAHRWGGGLVLARLLLDEPGRVAGRSVLDLGTGSGLVAIAAARAGASTVRAVDVDPHAVAAACCNAALNGVRVRADVGDILDQPPPDCDLVVAGDVFYAPDLAQRMLAFLRRCATAGCTVLVGDPGRASLPREWLEPVFSRPALDFGTADPTATATVYRLHP